MLTNIYIILTWHNCDVYGSFKGQSLSRQSEGPLPTVFVVKNLLQSVLMMPSFLRQALTVLIIWTAFSRCFAQVTFQLRNVGSKSFVIDSDSVRQKFVLDMVDWETNFRYWVVFNDKRTCCVVNWKLQQTWPQKKMWFLVETDWNQQKWWRNYFPADGQYA